MKPQPLSKPTPCHSIAPQHSPCIPASRVPASQHPKMPASLHPKSLLPCIPGPRVPSPRPAPCLPASQPPGPCLPASLPAPRNQWPYAAAL
uniref:Uncharacterized protein n=1 Tax=Anser brachyrhynchus TaxID=132585 RepID=A0A8B9CNC5_9AVES